MVQAYGFTPKQSTGKLDVLQHTNEVQARMRVFQVSMLCYKVALHWRVQEPADQQSW